MKKKHACSDSFAASRQRAEELLQQRPQSNQDYYSASPDEMRTLIHELSVYQVELELQHEELQQSRNDFEMRLAHYTDLYDFSPVGYLTLARDGRIVEVNLTGAKMLGVDRSRLHGKSFSRFIFPEHLPAFNALMDRVFKHQEAGSCDVLLLHSGESSIVRRTVHLEVIISKNKEECRIILADISRQVAFEETQNARHLQIQKEETSKLNLANKTILASEAYHRNLIDYMRNAYVYGKITYEDGRAVDFIHEEVNAGYEAITGLKDVVGKKMSEVIPGIEKVQPGFFERLFGVAETGIPDRFEIYMEPLKKWFDISVYCQQIGYFVVLFDDIGERKRALGTLQSLNRSLFAINNCNQALIHTNDETELLQKICTIIVETGGYRMAWVGYAEHDVPKSIRPVAQAGFDDKYLARLKLSWADVQHGPGPVGTAIRTGQISSSRNILEDAALEPWRTEAITRGYASLLSLPLRADNKVFGALTIYSEVPDAFNAEETKMLTSLAENLAYGITVLHTRKAHELVEDALRQSEKQFRTLFENHSAVKLLLDPDTGAIIDANQAAFDFYGWPVEELRRMNIQQINMLSPEEVMEKSSSSKQGHFSCRHRRADGSLCDVEVFSNKIEVAGKEILYEIIHDVTERMRYEFLIKFRLRILQMADTSSVDALLQTTLDEVKRLTQSANGFILFVAKDQLSLSLQVCSSLDGTALCCWKEKGTDCPLGNTEPWASVLREHRALIHDYDPPLRQCKGMPAGCHAEIYSQLVVPVIRNDRIVAILCLGNKPGSYEVGDVRWVTILANLMWDIVAKKIAETKQEKLQLQLQQAQKMELVGELAAGMAHEINNPLNFIAINFANIREVTADLQVILAEYQHLTRKLEEGTYSPLDLQKLRHKEEELHVEMLVDDIPEIVVESQRGFERITAIIDSMRNLSHRYAADNKVLFDINQGILDTLVITRHEYSFCADIKTTLGELPLVACHPEQINQVLLNLIINSIHAIQSRKRSANGTISIHTWFDSNNVYCSIADDGPGIPENIRQNIFNPFFTTKSPGKGTGLGLSISWDIIVIKHKGTISVDTPASGGTVFTLSLPRTGEA